MKKIAAVILTVVMMFAIMAEPVSALAGVLSNIVIANDKISKQGGVLPTASSDVPEGMHIMVRHWHSVDDPLGKEVLTEEPETGLKYLLIDLYLNENGDVIYSDSVSEEMQAVYDSYIVKKGGGSITINAKPYMDTNSRDVEVFSGFSVSAGQDAVTEDADGGTVTISYSKDIHLVKVHVYYNSKGISVNGINDDTVLGSDEGGQHDVGYVWGYEKDGQDYVLRKQDGNTVKYEKDIPFDSSQFNLPDDFTEAIPVKVYSTLPGLHTDKTAYPHLNEDGLADGRTFDIDLESWFIGQNLAQVGMVLDASGSMAFTSDELTPITVTDFSYPTIEKVSAEDLERADPPAEEGKYTLDSEAWSNIFLSQEQVEQILDNSRVDNSRLGYTNYNYYIYDKSSSTLEYVPIGYWNGEQQSAKSVEIDLNANLIGYYPFNKGGTEPSSPNSRDWVKNKKTEGYATEIDSMSLNDIGSSSFDGSGTDMSTTEGIGNFHFSSHAGLNMTYSTSDFNTGITDKAIILDTEIESGSFTVAFETGKHEFANSGDNKKEAHSSVDELIYIGGLKPADSGFIRIYRDKQPGEIGADDDWKNLVIEAVKTGEEVGKGHQKVTVKNVYSDGNNNKQESKDDENALNKNLIILTYNSETRTLTVYSALNQSGSVTKAGEITRLDLSDSRMILNAIQDEIVSEKNKPWAVFVDEISIFNTLLSEDQLNVLARKMNVDNEAVYPSGVDNKLFYETKTKFATNESDEVFAQVFDMEGGSNAGWYYINTGSDWDERYNNRYVMTEKEFRPLYSYYYADSDKDKKTPVQNTYTYDQSLTIEGTPINSLSYKPEGADDKSNEPIRFFIDAEGKLCCFYSPNTNEGSAYWSYVYEKKDEQRIKAETLQRALGSFITELNQTSPDSIVSAVRFSTQNVAGSKAGEGDYDKLVLLDWTNDPTESDDILSLNRGSGDLEGTTLGSTVSQSKDGTGLKQYNYGMTGGTYTATGLTAFQKYLADKGGLKPEEGQTVKKYLIIFTDGKDNLVSYKDSSPYYTYDEGKATSGEHIVGITKNIADELKQQGYTIFTVMLTGGSIKKDSPDPDIRNSYTAAKAYLLDLSGDKDGLSSETNPPNECFFEADNIEELTDLFTNEILKRISDNLNEYTVQDYIDPRFNLVDANGSTYTLGADGKVTVDGMTYTPIGDTGFITEVTLSESSDVDNSARKAGLYYDDDNNMYYLRWTDTGLSVPGSNVGDASLPVWNARITVQAKEDFIGGNDVLTNGNAGNENYVYQDDDANKNSGTDDMDRTDADKYPSKGFPRTTVNILVPEVELVGDQQVIYMGEPLTAKEVAKKLIEMNKDKWVESNAEDGYWYFEYLRRYADYVDYGGKDGDEAFEALLEAIIEAGDEGLEVEYFYIPDSSENPTNQTGNRLHHEQDQFCKLKFKWENIVGADEADDSTVYEEYPEKGEAEDTSPRKSKMTVEYKPVSEEDRDYYNSDIVNDDEDYKWSRDFKPSAGDALDTEGGLNATGEYETEIVSGEIIFDVKLKKSEAEYLKSLNSSDIKYTATLKRSYGDNIKDEVVGQFTFDLSDESIKSEEIGDYICYHIPLKDVDNKTINKLKIGTYTLSGKPDEKMAGLLSFSNIDIVDITAGDKDRFETYSVQDADITKYAAKYDETETAKFYLGEGYGEEPNTVYTDKRFGKAEVTASLGFGNLTIEKRVSGADVSDDNLKFSIQVTFTKSDGKPLSGNVMVGGNEQAIDDKGKIIVELTGGSSKVITGIPMGTKAEIEEIDIPDKYKFENFGYNDTEASSIKLDVLDDNKAILTIDGVSDKVIVNNSYDFGNLEITKVVTGPGGEKDRKFMFTISLTKDNKPVVGEFEYEFKGKTNEAYAMPEKISNGSVIYLADNESVTIKEIPAETLYSVTENDANEYGYVTTYTDATGTITRDGVASATIVNSKNESSLTVRKILAGSDAKEDIDSEKAFNFRVTLSGEGSENVTGSYGDMEFVNGVANITLIHGESKTADKLPDSYHYKVEEIIDDADVGKYSVSSLGEEGDIPENGDVSAVFVNTREALSSSLTITKVVAGANADRTRKFSFVITLTDQLGNPLTERYPFTKISQDDAIAALEADSETIASGESILLGHGESITITGLPAGTRYVVIEQGANQDGYTTESNGDIGEIPENGAANALFVNTLNTGNLSVTKVAEGYSDPMQTFEFKIDLSDKSINGTYGGMTFINGSATFILRHAETLVATDLPAGITYQIEELNVPANTVQTSSNAAGIIPGNDTVYASFINVYNDPSTIPNAETGTLKIFKIVTGAEEGRSFNFNVRIKPPQGSLAINGTYGDITFTDGAAEFTLSNNESKIVKNIPAGSTYEVEELDANTDGYITTYSNNIGTVMANTTAEAVVVNTKQLPAPEQPADTGSLTVVKVVTGENADRSLPFEFTVNITGDLPDGTYGGMTFTSGVATFSLSHGMMITATGLPAGITYTVSENPMGYTPSISNPSGTITPGSPATVVAINSSPIPANTGSLAVAKTVVGEEIDPFKVFSFTVTVSDPTLNGTYGDMTFINGLATFMLVNGQTCVADGLPAELTYQVFEAVDESYTQYDAVGNEGTILANNLSIAAFVNKKGGADVKTGQLIISKIVTGSVSEADKNQLFSFNVELSRSDINGPYRMDIDDIYSETIFTDGKTTISLKHGQTAHIYGLPDQTGYTVSEMPNEAYYIASSIGAQGLISSERAANAVFINSTNTGGLTVTKAVEGQDINTEQEFDFTVTLDNASINGNYGDMTFINGVATFKLKDGESISAEGLPAGTGYTVAEGDSNGYTAKSTGAEGTIPQQSSANALFVNRKDSQAGSLTISKKVIHSDGSALNAADLEKQFSYTIEFSDETINGEIGGVTFEAGAGTFTLKHGESKTFDGIPVGVSYKVTEANAAGYTQTCDNPQGTIVSGQTIRVDFINVKQIDTSRPPVINPGPVPDMFGTLTISKTVEDSIIDRNLEFAFTVNLYNANGYRLSGSYSYSGTRSGTVSSGGTVLLRHGDVITISGLPVGTQYSVSEVQSNDYIVSSSGASGTISALGSTAVFINSKQVDIDMPTEAADNRTSEENVCESFLSKCVAFTAESDEEKKRKLI